MIRNAAELVLILIQSFISFLSTPKDDVVMLSDLTQTIRYTCVHCTLDLYTIFMILFIDTLLYVNGCGIWKCCAHWRNREMSGFMVGRRLIHVTWYLPLEIPLSLWHPEEHHRCLYVIQIDWEMYQSDYLELILVTVQCQLLNFLTFFEALFLLSHPAGRICALLKFLKIEHDRRRHVLW